MFFQEKEVDPSRTDQFFVQVKCRPVLFIDLLVVSLSTQYYAPRAIVFSSLSGNLERLRRQADMKLS